MKTPYAHQRSARQQNTSTLLFDLWLNAPLSRAMLAQRNNLTKATVTAICDELAALNLIRRYKGWSPSECRARPKGTVQVRE